MFVRVSTFEGSPDQVDELTRYAAEQVLPALRELDGFNGILGLTDCQSSRVLAVWFSGRRRRPLRRRTKRSWRSTHGMRQDKGKCEGLSIED